MKNINIYKAVLLLFTLSLSISCDEGGDPDPGATSTVEMAGDWFVQLATDGVASGAYYQISTYNTSTDDGTEMWVDDHQNFWWFKAKSPVNLNSLTFSGSDLASSVDGYDITVSITNGAITKGDTETSAGNISDGISFDIEFSDDAGTIYSLVGYKRTGLLEDEH
ncbi:MAG: lipid-binding protein [Algibacter sp.]